MSRVSVFDPSSESGGKESSDPLHVVAKLCGGGGTAFAISHSRTFCALKIDVDDPELEDAWMRELAARAVCPEYFGGDSESIFVSELFWEPHSHTLFNLNMRLYGDEDGSVLTEMNASSNASSASSF